MARKDWNELFLARIRELVDKVKDQWGDLGSWKGFRTILQNIKIFKDILETVVLAVEQTWNEFDEFPREEKLDYAAKVLDDLIPFPGILEWFDQKIFKLILSLAVVWLNDRYGHNWKPITAVKFRLVGPGE